MIYDISYKTLIGAKPLRVRFDKVDEFIRVYYGTRHLVLLDPEKYDIFYNKNQNHYCYNIFLEKFLYQLPNINDHK